MTKNILGRMKMEFLHCNSFPAITKLDRTTCFEI